MVKKVTGTTFLFSDHVHKKGEVREFFIFLFSCPKMFTILHNDPGALQDHCVRCRIQTRNIVGKPSQKGSIIEGTYLHHLDACGHRLTIPRSSMYFVFTI